MIPAVVWQTSAACRGIWLDNDGGDLTHQEFARLFPRLRMVISNSYSSTAEKPRWRVFIPTTIAMPIVALRGHLPADHADGEPRWVLVADAA